MWAATTHAIAPPTQMVQARRWEGTKKRVAKIQPVEAGNQCHKGFIVWARVISRMLSPGTNSGVTFAPTASYCLLVDTGGPKKGTVTRPGSAGPPPTFNPAFRLDGSGGRRGDAFSFYEACGPSLRQLAQSDA